TRCRSVAFESVCEGFVPSRETDCHCHAQRRHRNPMPVTPTYPGVYVQELSSGVHTITGVATSITAFLGRASRGPSNEATTITSQADFERNVGPLDRTRTTTYTGNVCCQKCVGEDGMIRRSSTPQA